MNGQYRPQRLVVNYSWDIPVGNPKGVLGAVAMGSLWPTNSWDYPVYLVICFAALVIGVVQQMSTLVLPYQLQNTAIFVVFLLVIFLRPQGLFGRISERT